MINNTIDNTHPVTSLPRRSERVRRWDHLRKSHQLTTCEKCSVRLPKRDFEPHAAVCNGARSQWLVTTGECGAPRGMTLCG